MTLIVSEQEKPFNWSFMLKAIEYSRNERTFPNTDAKSNDISGFVVEEAGMAAKIS